jgi:hypothetical protein
VIRFDDLLAARVLHRQRADLRAALSEALRALDTDTEEQGHTLLGELVRGRTVPREQAEQVHDVVERWKRTRAVGIYARLLVDRGVPESTVQQLVRGLGEFADLQRLGDAAVARGLVPKEAEARLRFQAKQAFDVEAAREVDEYRARRKSGATAKLGPEGTGELASKVPSGVFRPGVEIASAAEVTSILEASPSMFIAPRVPVPDWVDTANAMVGRTVGPYRILGKVGAGAMATVYLAEKDDATIPFALKLVPPGASREVQARFKREILANGFFDHEHAITVHDAGATPEGHQYLVMEFFDSQDLEVLLKSQGTLSLRQSMRVASQVGRALQAAHDAGIIHRDVKPANILVSRDSGTAKLMDFGLALIRDLGEFKDKVFESDSGHITGTPEYVSPEQALGDPLGPASDVYSLGLTLYRCLAGRLPFEAKSPGAWIQARLNHKPVPLSEVTPGTEWPPALLQLIDRALVKDPAKRTQSAREVSDALDAVFDGLASTRRHLPFRRGF